MKRYELRFFQKSRGDQPALDYIESLPKKEQMRLSALMCDLEVNGTIEPTKWKKLKGYDLYELKFKSHRLIGFYHLNQIVFVSGFRKKSNKTPKSELDAATKRKKLYQGK